ncbi:MAG: excinuclease ABC subunit UvrC [Nitrospiraceae bacterium]|nr:excinuclease ABC subunit UvrC [Nitrospiraceae bacterium]
MRTIQDKLARVPAKPGVYFFKDEKGRILYVGKARDLKNRLRSYFQKSAALDERKAAMVRSVRDFEYTVTENELEAFVLEANLIKQFRPRYNILLRDDKSYPYLKLTVNETWPRLEVVRRVQKDGARYFGPYVPAGAMWEILSFIRNNFNIRTCKYSLEKRMRPCIQHQIKRCIAPCGGHVDHDEYMQMIDEVRLLLEGRNSGLLNVLEKKMRRLSAEMKYEEAALLRDRIRAIRQISERQKAVAPQLGDVDVIGIFREAGRAVFKILFIRNGFMIGSRHFIIVDAAGETDGALLGNFIGRFYEKEIIPAPEVLCPFRPEDAGLLASWLSGRRDSAVKIAVPKRGIRKKLVAMAEENALLLSRSDRGPEGTAPTERLTEFLGLEKVPEDIGAFDISNIAGKEPVGAFVYWADGMFRKDKYRHIRMDAVQGPDDYAMMKEMVRRTFKKSGVGSEESGMRRKEENTSHLAPHPSRLTPLPVPDLIVIDGGKGQLGAARKALEELGIDTAVIAVAKDPDRAFLADREEPLSLEDGGAPSLLLRRIRDEVHRFAVRYHKKLRAKRTFESPLEKIPGVARKRRFALLKHFGSIEAIRSAPVEEIAGLKGFHRKIAEKIHESLAKSEKETA